MTTKRTDFVFANHGTITILTPRTKRAQTWLDSHVQQNDETQYWGKGIVIEPRFADDILEGLQADGLTVA